MEAKTAGARVVEVKALAMQAEEQAVLQVAVTVATGARVMGMRAMAPLAVRVGLRCTAWDSIVGIVQAVRASFPGRRRVP